MKHIPEIDIYIDKSQEFAKPILVYIRSLMHEACPDCEEAIKWGYPHFTYHGKILTAMASFKQHCTFGFWLDGQITTLKEVTKDRIKDSMYSLGRIKSIDDLPTKQNLIEVIHEAMELTDSGAKVTFDTSASTQLDIPKELEEALKKNIEAQKVFEKATPSFRKEYIKWIADAKTEATKNKRLEQAVEWITEGKGRNWKYEKKYKK